MGFPVSASPRHWQQRLLDIWQNKGVISAALLPLSGLYGAVLHLRRWRYARFPPALPIPAPRPPIIVVGNLMVGGTGKTPTVIALAVTLKQYGWQPGIISRGYGVRVGTAARTGYGDVVDAARFGDEPALIARETCCPIAVHPKRLRALQALLTQYPEVDCVIADDGLQHLALPRDATVIVQDARGLGNGRLLPAGPLREPAQRLLDAQVIITNLTAQSQPEPPPAPPYGDTHPQALSAHHATLRLKPDSVTRISDGVRMRWQDWCQQHQGQAVAALAGIGQPERFFAMLRVHGQPLAHTCALADHAALDAARLRGLETAQALLITEKDAIKLSPASDARLWSVHVTEEFAGDVLTLGSDPDHPCFSFKWVDHIHTHLVGQNYLPCHSSGIRR